MSVEKDDNDLQSPSDVTPLAPGVWVTEAPGFACVPPRAQSDLRNTADEAGSDQPAAAGPADEARGTTPPRDDIEPRIERYRER